MASADMSPPQVKNSPPDSDIAPPIGAGSVETTEMDCEVTQESILPKQYAGPPTGGFPQRVLPPLLPPSTTPGHDMIMETPRVAAPVEAQPNHRFIFHQEPPPASIGRSALPADRPNKRKRCSGLTKMDKLALINICTRHKADYKQGDKTGFWDLVKKSMLAETGKDLAQPRSMVERWCSWEIDQILERQTTHDQQDFRLAVKDFCARWKEVRQEYNSKRQSKANATEDTSQARAGEREAIFGKLIYGDNDDSNVRRFRSVLGDVRNSGYDTAAARSQSVDNLYSHVHKGKVSGSHFPPSDVPISNNPSVEARVGNTTGGNTYDSGACGGSSINGKARDSTSNNHAVQAPIRGALKSGTPYDNASSGTVPDGNVPKANALVQNTVVGNTRPYHSPYQWGQYRIGPDNTTPISNVPYNNKVEIASASLPTPRASISGSQSSASSPITSMDIRHFPHARVDNKRNLNTDTPQSSNRVTSSPIDDLAQAYVTRTYEASFDILRDIMTKHDEIVRQISASKSLLATELEASKRHSDKVERELGNCRRLLDGDKTTLRTQLENSEAQNVASQQLIDSLQRQKADALTKLQDSYQLSQQLQKENKSLEKQLNESKRPSAEATGGVEAPLVETISKKLAVGKDLETCQRQLVKIKNEKSVLELELSVSKRQIQELKAHIPYPTERREGSSSSHNGVVTLSPKST